MESINFKSRIKTVDEITIRDNALENEESYEAFLWNNCKEFA